MAEFSEFTIELPTGPLTYLQGGSGPALLHLHSAAGPRLSPMIERLAAKHTVFMPTVPGFNATPVHANAKAMQDLATLAAAFVERAIGKGCGVIAESFGGWIALWLAVKRP